MQTETTYELHTDTLVVRAETAEGLDLYEVSVWERGPSGERLRRLGVYTSKTEAVQAVDVAVSMAAVCGC